LVFGYFFYWTVHEDFPPSSISGPGWVWPATAALLLTGAWGLTLLARKLNRKDRSLAFHLSTAGAVTLSAGGTLALLAGPWTHRMDPTQHVYPAIVWVLVLWTAVHVLTGILMLAYCMARRAAGRMTARHDIDICNVALYCHFLLFTALITAAVIGGFPLVA
jgi:cytochrome c oxidase subunit I+III